MNQTVNSMDELTQQNAALAEEASAASASMMDTSNVMVGHMKFFRVSDNGAGSKPASVSNFQAPAAPSPTPSQPKSVAAAPEQKAPAAKPVLAVASGGDEDWEEF